MRVKNIDISQFTVIEDVYSFMDYNAFDFEREWDITDLWVKYRNKTNDEREKQQSQWEINCFIFNLKGDQLFSQVYSNNYESEKIKGDPDLNDIQESMIEYVKQRANNSLNPLLKSRYNHLLWKCPIGIKNNHYAEIAIKNYVESINKLCDLYQSDKNDETLLEIGRLFETLLALCNDIRTDLTLIKELTNKLLFQLSDFKFFIKHSILNEMLDYPKIFKTVDFENVLSIFEKEITKSRDIGDDFHHVNYYLPTAIRIAQRIKSDTKKWHNEMGLAYLRLANGETQKDRFWIKQNYHSKAIQAFTLAKNKEKRTEAEYLYTNLKPNIKLDSILIEFDEMSRKTIQEVQENIKQITKNTLTKDPDVIYKTISEGSIFPKYENIINVLGNKENGFLDLVSITYFDKNKNISNPSKEARDVKKIYNVYGHYVNLIVMPYLHHIIITGIKSGHLTFDSLITFIAKNSWMGKAYTKYDLGGNERSINWIKVLAPSIVEFFLQIQAWSNSKFYNPSFVLCIDSLTLKFEGLLREFCERINIPTSVSKIKGMQEIYMHNVLENEIFKKYFNDDDLLLFNYLFSNENGLNLRNNVAHCFFDYSEYHLPQMLLLIAALLRLAKYDYIDDVG